MRWFTAPVLVAAALAAPAPAVAGGHDAFVPGELIVRFAPGADAADRTAARKAAGARLERGLGLARTQVVEVDGSVAAAARALRERDDVLYAHPNYIWHTSALPNDARLGELWGLHNGAGADIDAARAWDVTTGSEAVKIAVLDSGVDADHPDLIDNIWRNPGEAGNGRESNGVDDDGNGKVDDWRGWDFTDNDNDPHDGAATHGTHVAGTIGAQGNNGLGVVGVNWNTGLMPLRVGRDDKSIDMAAAVDAVGYAGRMGARVANLSFGGPAAAGQPPLAMRDAMRGAPNTLFVAAAGNETNDNDKAGGARYPCGFSSEPNVVCVAATDDKDGLADFSNFGPGAVQLAAPGVDTVSTVPIAQIHDDFETEVPGRWKRFDALWGGFYPVSASRWARTTETAHTGSYSYTDSPGTLADQVTNSGIVLSTPVSTIYDPGADGGYHHCFIDFWWRPRPDRNPYISPMAQSLHVDTLDPSFFVSDAWFDTATLNMAAFPDTWQHANVVFLPGHLLKHRIRVRFRLEVFNVPSGDGVYIDDVKIWCGLPVPPEYEANSGTSMAAPHVAGVAGLLAARSPGMSSAAMKQALLGSVELAPGLAGKVATGGRLNAARALAYAGPPETVLQDGPTGETASRTPTFTFTASDPNVRFECRIDAAPFAACASPYTAPELAPGAHTFAVRAADPAGVADASPATRSFTVLAVEERKDEETKPCLPGTEPCDDARLLSLKLARGRLILPKRAGGVVKTGGIEVAYTLSTAATVAFGVERSLPGRRAGTRCAAATKRNRRAKHCTIWKAVKGELTQTGKAGENRLRFGGRIGNVVLKPGRHRLWGRVAYAREQLTAPFSVSAPKRRR